MSLLYTGPADNSKYINHEANAFLDDMRSLAGKTRVAVTQTATTGVLLTVGQSLFANYNGAPYTAGANVYNFNAFDGRCYVCADPLLGCAGTSEGGNAGIEGNQAGRIADALIAAGEFTHCVVAPIAVGGTRIDQWATGGNLVQRLIVALARLREQGFVPSAVLLEIGQQDAGDGTSQAAWQASFSTFRSVIRANGCNAPIFVAQCTWRPSTSNATIRAAQAAVVNPGLGVYAGPDIDTLIGGNRQGGSPHLNATGAAAAAILWRNAIQAVL